MEREIIITKKMSRKGEDGYKVVSVRMKEDLVEQLDVLSERTNRSRNELINILFHSAIQLVSVEDGSPCHSVRLCGGQFL